MVRPLRLDGFWNGRGQGTWPTVEEDGLWNRKGLNTSRALKLDGLWKGMERVLEWDGLSNGKDLGTGQVSERVLRIKALVWDRLWNKVTGTGGVLEQKGPWNGNDLGIQDTWEWEELWSRTDRRTERKNHGRRGRGLGRGRCSSDDLWKAQPLAGCYKWWRIYTYRSESNF